MDSLQSGKDKLVGHIQYGNLPKDRNDGLWVEIRVECGLTLDELSALKNAVCSPSVPVISQAPLPPAPLPFLRRFYVLFNLKRPAEMLERGVRDYIVSQMRGRAIGGMVYREKLPSYGQSVIIRACGTREALRSLETSVLSRDGNEYWEWDVDTPMYRDCEVEHISSHEFSIAESRRGAICGASSDPKNDNKSEKSSRTGKSSKSDRQSPVRIPYY